jgi:hypothetical protein
MGVIMDYTVMVADKGNVFRRVHDGCVMSRRIHLGYDHSTGTKRQDLPEYYEQIEDPEPGEPEELEETQ